MEFRKVYEHATKSTSVYLLLRCFMKFLYG